MTKIIAIVKDANSQWTETYNRQPEDSRTVEEQLEDIFEEFNSSRRPNELPRTLVSFILQEDQENEDEEDDVEDEDEDEDDLDEDEDDEDEDEEE